MKLAPLALRLTLILAIAAKAAASPGFSKAAHLRIDVRSHEEPAARGSFRVDFRFSSPQGGPFGLIPDIELRKNERCLQGAVLTSDNEPPADLAPGGSYTGTFEVSFDPKERPFSYATFRLGVRSADSAELLTFEHVFVYFTPYETVEVWSADDFDGLKRVWSSPMDSTGPRRFVGRDAIPKSDLSDAEIEDPTVPRRLMTVQGLAYSVPRKAAQTALPRLDARNPARSSRFARMAARAALPAGPEGLGAGGGSPDAATPDGQGAALRKSSNRFEGHVVGSLFATVDTDFANTTAQLAIVDIKVELMLKKSLGDEVLGTDFTGEGGVFDIAFDVTRNDPSIDVYLLVTAENSMGSIRVRKRLGGARSESIFKDSPHTFDPGTGHFWDFTAVELDTSDLKPQLLHWANRARQFVDSQGLTGFSLPTNPNQPLDIMRSFVGSGTAYTIPTLPLGNAALIALVSTLLGVPGGAIAAIFISNNDAIYVGSQRELDEDVIYHEFVHYLMWHLQAKSWLDPLKAGFATHYQDVNDPHAELAWTEGFASGFGMIVDATFQADDNEFGLDGAFRIEDRSDGSDATSCPTLDAINWTVNCGGNSTPDCSFGGQVLTHGFFSEWSVAAMIWDLWDGPSHLGSATPITCGGATTFDDGGRDQVELSFEEIVQPILDNPGQWPFGFVGQGGNLLNNAMDYFTYLRDNPPASLASLPLATAQRQIKDVFVASGVRNLSEAVTAGGLERIALEADLPNTDLLGFTREVTIDQFKPTDDLVAKSKGTESGTFEVDVSMLLKQKDDFNLARLDPVVDRMELSDDFLVTSTEHKGSGTLFFNHPTPFGWQSAGNTYGQPMGVLLPAGNSLEAHLAGGMFLTVVNGGTINLGHDSGSHTANVHLDEGGTFILSGGKLTVNPGSHFIIERGATLVIGPGAEIELRNSSSSLDIHGNLIILPGSSFKPTGDGWVNFDLPDQGGLPNFTMGLLSSMVLFELHFTIAAKTYVKPNEVAGTLIDLHYSTGLFGSESYLDVSRSAFIGYWSTIASGGGLHAGIILNGYANSITGCRFSGGNPCIRGIAQSTTGISVVDSEFTTGVYGILSEGLSVGVSGSTFNLFLAGVHVTDSSFGLTDSDIAACTTGVRSIRGGGAMSGTKIHGCGIGWNATELQGSSTIDDGDVRENKLFGALIEADDAADLTIERTLVVDNGLGISVAGPVMFKGTCVYVARNTTSGLLLARGAVLDVSYGAGCRIISSPISVTLVSAGVPILQNGDNEFTPSAGGYTFKGTIDADCTVTPSIHAWRNTGSGVTPLDSSLYDLTDPSGSCTFQLQGTTVAGATNCP